MIKNNDIGFLLIKLTNDTFYDRAIETIRTYVDNNPFDQVVIFNSYCDHIDTKNIPILHISHAKFFYGKLVVFDLASVLISQNFTNISNRYLYTNNIPWSKSPETSYSDWSELYGANNLNIIVSDHSLYDIYSMMWKTPVGISENFNYDTIQNFIR